jgi:hypothetical protein
MPLNEAKGYRSTRGGLTPAQQREQTLAIYGQHPAQLEQRELSNQSMDLISQLSQMSEGELEQLRALLGTAPENKKNFGKVESFDLNDPPKVPYRHQDFPRVVYHHTKRTAKKALHHAELEELLAAGYSLDPLPIEDDEPEQFDPATAAEIAAKDAEARKPKAKK